MTIIIEDLVLDAELDKEAMMAILGGRKSSAGKPVMGYLVEDKYPLRQEKARMLVNKQLGR